MKLIYDIGAHIGRDTEFYLRKGFKVIAVEANPYCCKEIRNNFNRYIQTGQLILKECAISNSPYPIVDFIIHKLHTDWGTTDPKWNNQYPNEIEQIKVPGCTLTSLLYTFGMPYYIKIDIEGGDAMCIRQLKGLKLPKYLSAELLTFNNILDKNVNCIDVIHALLDVGYTKFQLVDQGKNQLTQCPIPALEGNYVENWKFDGYSSGLFGKELPDNWESIDKILLQYIHYFNKIKNCSGDSLDEGSWYDIHCKLD